MEVCCHPQLLLGVAGLRVIWYTRVGLFMTLNPVMDK
jgi:hypothetical protein